jgi:RNA polymerase sigma factor (TIGR02999 family)
MPLPAPDSISRLMQRFRQGDQKAAQELVELFYPELRQLALAHMKRERGGHSWQPTVLVNELYLKLIRIKALPPMESEGGERAAFFGLAAHLMKRLLIEHARPLYRHVEKVPIDIDDDLISEATGRETLVGIDTMLSRLGTINPKLRTIVELKVFEGFTGEEIAERLGCAPATVARHWYFAREWLKKEWPFSQKTGKSAPCPPDAS